MNKKNSLEISEYIDSLGIELPERNNFDKLNSWLPVPNTNEEVSRDSRTSRNFERGRLLYALVAKNKPKTMPVGKKINKYLNISFKDIF